MKLNCAILHPNHETAARMAGYIEKIPFLCCCEIYTDALTALTAYHRQKVELYWVGICPVGEDEIDGREFSRLLDAYTRVVFVADTGRYAAECFRLDALDYLTVDAEFSLFYQAASKAARWFAVREEARSAREVLVADNGKKLSGFINIRVNNRILRLELDSIDYIESCGDYVKIYYRGGARPLLSLCSMKYMEERLPADKFIRIHRSYMVRCAAIKVIDNETVTVGQKELPVGVSYRKRLRDYVSGLRVL